MESLIQDINKYWKLINKRKNAFILSAVSIITIALLISYSLPDIYEAKSAVLIETNVIKNLIKDIAVTPSMEERLRVISYTMTSRNLLLKVIEKMGFDLKTMSNEDVEVLVKGFQDNTTIKSTSKMDLFSVSFRHRDPELAKDYVNSLIGVYIEGNISDKREEAYGASRFLSEQIRFFKDKLDNAELKIVRFRKDKGVIVAIDERDVVGEIKTAQEKLEDLKIKMKELGAKEEMIRKKIKEEDPYAIAILGKKGRGVQGMSVVLQSRLNELLMKYTEVHPDVLRVKEEIEALKAQGKDGNASRMIGDMENEEAGMSTLNPIYQQLKEEQARTGLELAAIAAKEKHFNSLIDSKKAYLRNMPDEKKKLIDLEREKDTYMTIYEDLVQRLGRSEVSKQMEVQDKAATFKIVDPAILPVEPVSPNRLRLLLLGIFAGLAGGFGVVVLLDHTDNSVKNLETIKTFDMPLLAIIPNMQNSEETMKKRREDALLYGLACVYMLLVLSVIAFEFLESRL
jgi:polysaccharide chain length determinant protein (PEP-CTERM system associated)